MTLETQIPRQCDVRVCQEYSGSCTNSIGSNNACAGNTANGNGSCIASTSTANTVRTRARTHPVQSKESSLTHRLQAPDKEATVRFTVDMSVGRAPQTVGVGSKDRAQESGLLVRMLLEEGLKEEV